jgi:HD-GYP domain-containing protein (c-di-GMP phosphodiesterase class II)
MPYVPLPLARLQVGKPLPVDIWDAGGKLLLRKGHAILSEQQIELLREHQACMTEADARAWQRSFERMIHTLREQGADVTTIAHASLPTEILEADYGLGQEVLGGWLDLQEILRGLLYQGAAAIRPLPRLQSIEARALELLKSDPDEALFILFQALADSTLGYCATHALLSAVVCELAASKLGMNERGRQVLFRAALVMNIGLARDQDKLASQSWLPTEVQRRLIREHPQHGVDILRAMGVLDEQQLDIVRWHHEQDESAGLASNLMSRRILRSADSFVAKMAARKTRLAMSALGATQSLFLGATPDAESIASALAAVLGFYPPGTYVQLVNDEKAVVAQRGQRANHPHVVSIVNPGGMALSHYLYRDTTDPHYAIRSPLNAEKIKVKVSLEKVAKVRADHRS